MFHKYACNCRAINNKQNVATKLDISSFKIDEEDRTCELENKKKHHFL